MGSGMEAAARAGLAGSQAAGLAQMQNQAVNNQTAYLNNLRQQQNQAQGEQGAMLLALGKSARAVIAGIKMPQQYKAGSNMDDEIPF